MNVRELEVCRDHSGAHAEVALIEPEVGRDDLSVAVETLDLTRLSEKDVVPAPIRSPAFARGFPSEMGIRIIDASVVLDLVLVVEGRGIGVALSPECLDKAVPLLDGLGREKHLALALSNNVDDLALEPGLVLFGKPVDALVRGGARREDHDPQKREDCSHL